MQFVFHDQVSYVGRGIPEELAKSTNHARQLPATAIPNIQQAVDSYEATGGRLLDAADFGTDPLRDSEELKMRREQLFAAAISSIDSVFHCVVNGHLDVFKGAIVAFVDITVALARQCRLP
jgi:hypothetical protein